MTTITRPGITPEFLAENEVRHVSAVEAESLCGCPASGLAIPYRHLQGSGLVPLNDPTLKRYYRLRKDDPGDYGRYHQLAGTGPHAYPPANFLELHSGTEITVVEGEFKALSLSDTHQKFATPSVGISGFFGFQEPKGDSESPRFVRELRDLISLRSLQRVLFLGDADTSLNFDFSLAAIRLKKLLPNTQVHLPRIPLDQPKGIDDVREKLREEFPRFWHRLVDDSIEVKPHQEPGELALTLMEPALMLAKAMGPSERPRVVDRFIKLAARLPGSYATEAVRMAKAHLKLGATELNRQIEQTRRKNDAARREATEAALRPRLSRYWFAAGTYFQAIGDKFRRIPSRQDAALALGFEEGLTGHSASGPRTDEIALNLVQRERAVDWAGPLAGHPAGVQEQGGHRILVTEGPLIIAAQRGGDVGWIMGLLSDFVGRTASEPHYTAQLWTLIAWLAARRRALLNPRVHLPTPVLCLFGPTDIGKTLVQDEVVTPILGGRSHDPLDCWTGRSGFNDAVLGAEHLGLSDPMIDSTDTRVLSRFQGELIRSVSNTLHARAQKFEATRMLRPVQGVSVSINATKDALKLLPLNRASARDKFILLRCHSIGELPSSDPQARKIFTAQIRESLPELVGFLDAWIPPEQFVDERFGVAAFQHPELLALAGLSDPVLVLRNFVEPFATPEGFTTTAAQFFEGLAGRHGDQFRQEFPDPRALGKGLAKASRAGACGGILVEQVGKVGYGQSRNYTTSWRVKKV